MKHRGTAIKFGLALAAAALCAAIAVQHYRRPVAVHDDLVTYAAKRGELVIDVLESGSVEASDALVIKSEVEGRATILYIIPEGTILTEQDVREGRLLVSLDSSQLRDDETRQQIELQAALANYSDASASYQIQIKQNESDEKQGELKVKFARLDLEKYLGAKAAAAYMQGTFSLAKLIGSELLEGEALQTKRKLENDIDLAREEAARAEVKLEWTTKLEAKGYVTRNDLQADALALKRHQVSLEQAQTALELFKQYEFPKNAEKLLADYKLAVNELDNVLARNDSELAKAEARLAASEATLRQQQDKLAKIQEQIKKCVITATVPGMVVYAGSDSGWGRDNPIQEGGEVRERQEIIKIPSSTSMLIKAKIHESVIARVREGQPAEIVVDAIPGQTFAGEVTRVALLPDTERRWLSPNLKVYATDIALKTGAAELRPGMSAQVRIITQRLADVVFVPLQAVHPVGDKTICYVKTLAGVEEREVVLGEFNDKFTEIKQGLAAGERVVLNMPAPQPTRPQPEPDAPATPTAPPDAAAASNTPSDEASPLVHRPAD